VLGLFFGIAGVLFAVPAALDLASKGKQSTVYKAWLELKNLRLK